MPRWHRDARPDVHAVERDVLASGESFAGLNDREADAELPDGKTADGGSICVSIDICPSICEV
jgi:hypothetical protein